MSLPSPSYFKNNLSLKTLSIGGLILLMMIPAFIIRDVVGDRQFYRENALGFIEKTWGGEQVVSGPILAIPYTYYREADGKRQIVSGHAFFLPDILNLQVTVQAQKKRRGIFTTVVYTSAIHMDADYSHLNYTVLGLDQSAFQWSKAKLLIGLSDVKGINSQIHGKWNAQPILFEPGFPLKHIAESTVAIDAPLSVSNSKRHIFQTTIELRGSRKLLFTPLGKETKIGMVSDWGNPSFTGAFIPQSHAISRDSFKAQWSVFNLNRSFPQQWLDANMPAIAESAFGVELLTGPDIYTKINRVTKYAILFVSLTFTMIFLIELAQHKRVHPIQYILIGLALSVFYLLLLSLSEFIGFDRAYLIAALTISALIGAYAKSVFLSRKITVLVTLIILFVYAYLFILLQLQDYSLLLGTIGLLVVIGMLMVVTRKVDWYGHLSSDHVNKRV